MNSLRQRTVRLSSPDEIFISERGEASPVLRDVLSRYRALVHGIDCGLSDYQIAIVADLLGTHRATRYLPNGPNLFAVMAYKYGHHERLSSEVLTCCEIERKMDIAERICLSDRLDVLTWKKGGRA